MSDDQKENTLTEPVEQSASSFESAAEEENMSLVAEFVLFLKENKAWWMIPILLALCLIGAAVFMSGSPLAPFIYPLF